MARDYYNIEAPTRKCCHSASITISIQTSEAPEEQIFINAADYNSAENGDITTGSFTDDSGESRDGVLLWNSAEGEVTYEFEVQRQEITA